MPIINSKSKAFYYLTITLSMSNKIKTAAVWDIKTNTYYINSIHRNKMMAIKKEKYFMRQERILVERPYIS